MERDPGSTPNPDPHPGPYQERFPIGCPVQVADSDALAHFKETWEFHHPLQEEQLQFAGLITTINSVGYYHGGDVLYGLRGTGGYTWHEACLRAVGETTEMPMPDKAAKPSRIKPLLAIATFGLTLLWPTLVYAAARNADIVSVAVQVFPCDQGLAAAPTLTVENLEATFAAVPVSLYWSRTKSTWVGRFSAPAGHYLLRALSVHCSGESEQWVAIPGELRHVAITLNKPPHVANIDENMFADAVDGRLPSPASRVEVMRADSVVGEQGRRVATLDGSSYQLGNLSEGPYIVRVTFGNVVVSREVVFPPHVYGFAIEADLTPEDAQVLVQEQESGSGFVDVPNYGTTKASTFRYGRAAVSGWSTDPLLFPSDYNTGTQRLSIAVLRGLEAARNFLATTPE